MTFKDYKFITEEANNGGLTPAVKKYIDDKFTDIETKLQDAGSGGSYNVLPSSDGLLDIIDIDKQVVAGKLSYPGELISAPIVHGNKVSFGVQERRGEGKHQVYGAIYELPGGNNIGTFRVEQDDPDSVYRKIMGTQSLEDEEPVTDFDSDTSQNDDTDDNHDDTDSSTDDVYDDEVQDLNDLDYQRQKELEDLRSDVEQIKQREKQLELQARKSNEDKEVTEPVKFTEV